MKFTPLPDQDLPTALQRGRQDPAFFSHYFLQRKLHDGQADFVTNAQATINCLPTSNRWGKTAALAVRHFYRCFYKDGAERHYTDENGVVDVQKYLQTRYFTVHTADLWDTASLVWQDALKMIAESARLRAFIKDTPRTLPPKIVFTNGSQWFFRTLGGNGEGIDGYSFYHISIDEAGWIKNLEPIIENVARIRVGDTRGMIDLVGTMKVGISRPFYRYANRAAVYTGTKVAFDHRDGRDYAAEFEKEIARATAA